MTSASGSPAASSRGARRRRRSRLRTSAPSAGSCVAPGLAAALRHHRATRCAARRDARPRSPGRTRRSRAASAPRAGARRWSRRRTRRSSRPCPAGSARRTAAPGCRAGRTSVTLTKHCGRLDQRHLGVLGSSRGCGRGCVGLGHLVGVEDEHELALGAEQRVVEVAGLGVPRHARPVVGAGDVADPVRLGAPPASRRGRRRRGSRSGAGRSIARAARAVASTRSTGSL